MTTCTQCGKPLPTTLDEYGPELNRPVCFTCWHEAPTLYEKLADEREVVWAYRDDDGEAAYFLSETQLEALDNLIKQKPDRYQVRRMIVNLTRRIDWLKKDQQIRFAQWCKATPTTYPIINNQYSFLEESRELIHLSAIPA